MPRNAFRTGYFVAKAGTINTLPDRLLLALQATIRCYADLTNVESLDSRLFVAKAWFGKKIFDRFSRSLHFWKPPKG